MRFATHIAVEYARQQHAAIKYTTDPDEMARAWGVRIIPGDDNSAAAGPPAIITMKREHYAPRQRFTINHEFAHILIQRSMQERAIRREVSSELSGPHLEAVTNYIAAILAMPDNLVHHAFKEYGLTPETVLFIQQAARVSLPAAVRRFTYASGEEYLTTFITSGPYIYDMASTQDWPPMHRYQRIPDVRAKFPDSNLLRLPGSVQARSLGVIIH